VAFYEEHSIAPMILFSMTFNNQFNYFLYVKYDLFARSSCGAALFLESINFIYKFTFKRVFLFLITIYGRSMREFNGNKNNSKKQLGDTNH